MEQKYKITAIIISLFIAFCPLLTTGFISYADNVPGGSGGEWDPIETHEDIVSAFKAYCQTTGLNTEHVPNTVKAIVKWDYSQLEKYAALANVDLEGLNAHIWYQVQQNKPLKFYFDSTGITSCQKIYSEIISENDIQPNTTKRVYNGKYFEDSDGNGCFCFIKNNHDPVDKTTESQFLSSFTNIGTYYRIVGSAYFNQSANGSLPLVINYHNTSKTVYLCKRDNINDVDENNWVQVNKTNNFGNYVVNSQLIYVNNTYRQTIEGYLAILYDTSSRTYYLSHLHWCNNILTNTGKQYYFYSHIELTDATADNSTIDYNQGEPVEHPEDKSMEVTTGDTTINNYITNNNTNITYNYDDNNEPPSSLTPLPPTPTYPTGGTQDPDGNFQWSMPDLNIDFHIDSDISDIFPFSIPFDIIHFFDLFDSEPVTPEVDTTFEICNIEIPLQFDLHWLDDTAAYVRAFVLAIYCFGLAIATRALFHIY